MSLFTKNSSLRVILNTYDITNYQNSDDVTFVTSLPKTDDNYWCIVQLLKWVNNVGTINNYSNISFLLKLIDQLIFKTCKFYFG